jgi:hypothetical protein
MSPSATLRGGAGLAGPPLYEDKAKKASGRETPGKKQWSSCSFSLPEKKGGTERERQHSAISVCSLLSSKLTRVNDLKHLQTITLFSVK